MESESAHIEHLNVELGPWIEELRIPDPPTSTIGENREIIVTGLQWVKKGPVREDQLERPDAETLLFVAYMYHGVV